MTFTACVTTTKSVLPAQDDFKVNSNKKIYIELESGLHDDVRELILNSIQSSGINPNNIQTNYPASKQYIADSNLKNIDDFFPIKIPDNQSSDLQIKLIFKSYGYYISVCPAFLGVFPCMPPVRWVVGARVSSKKSSFNKDYLIKEDVNGILWLPFFSPNFWNQNTVAKQVMERMFRNLLLQMNEDKIL